MDNQSLDEEKQTERDYIHHSLNFFPKKNKLSLEGKEKKYLKKRSNSMLTLFSKNFVPQLKPIKANICPSPINLNIDPKTKGISEIHEINISKESFDSQKDINIKSLNFIRSNKIKKKSFKILNIEEKTHSKSDIEDRTKKMNKIQYDSEDSSIDEERDNKNEFKNKKEKFINISLMREIMTRIKNSFILKIKILSDDFDIKNHIFKKSLNQKLDKQKIKKNKILNFNSFKTFKYRTKTFYMNSNLVFSILDFLEKKK